MEIKCQECGQYYKDSYKQCPLCNPPKKDSAPPDAKIPHIRRQPHVRMQNRKGQTFEVDCAACKLDGGMEAARLPRFSWFIRFIGGIIAIPSILGMIFAVMIFFTGSSGMFGQGSGNGMAIGMSLFVFCISAVSGLVGWLLLMKKNVFQCTRCGYILNRS